MRLVVQWRSQLLAKVLSLRISPSFFAIYSRLLGAGSGYQFCQPAGDARAGANRGGARRAASDSLRQRAGADQPSFSGVVRGAEDRAAAYRAGTTDAERAGGKF